MDTNKALGFARHLVFQYAKYDSMSCGHELSLNDIPEFDLNEFSAVIMQDSISHANESTGSDNPSYDFGMLPSLINFLKDTSNEDRQKAFVDEWKNGVTKYYARTMDTLLCRALREYNDDKGCGTILIFDRATEKVMERRI